MLALALVGAALCVAPPPRPASVFFTSSRALRDAGVSVRLAQHQGKHVTVWLDEDERTEAVARYFATTRDDALFLPFSGGPPVPLERKPARRGSLALGGECGRHRLRYVDVPVGAARKDVAEGLVVLGARVGDSVSWEAAPAPLQEPDGAVTVARFDSLGPRPCVRLVEFRWWVEPLGPEGRCRLEPPDAPGRDARWSTDEDAGVIGWHGVLVARHGERTERWLVVSSMYVEASGPVAIPLIEDEPTRPSAAHLTCRGIVHWVGDDGEGDEAPRSRH